MTRRLLNLLTALSLVLFVAVCADWIDSYRAENFVSCLWWHDRDGDPLTEKQAGAGWCRGSLLAQWSERDFASPAEVDRHSIRRLFHPGLNWDRASPPTDPSGRRRRLPLLNWNGFY